MGDRGHRGFLALIAAGIVLILILAVLGLRLEERLGSIEKRVLERAPSAPPLHEVEAGIAPESVAAGQTVYVPVYSHIYHQGGRELPLETTLSIRNTDLDSPIVLESVRYHGTGGEMIKEYLRAPAILAPLASADFLVERRDATGGAGANFLVRWVAEDLVDEPVIEAVMVSTEGNKALSFSSSGRPVTVEMSAE